MADLWEYYIPYLYSGISLFGVLLLLCEFFVLERITSIGRKVSLMSDNHR